LNKKHASSPSAGVGKTSFNILPPIQRYKKISNPLQPPYSNPSRKKMEECVVSSVVCIPSLCLPSFFSLGYFTSKMLLGYTGGNDMWVANSFGMVEYQGFFLLSCCCRPSSPTKIKEVIG